MAAGQPKRRTSFLAVGDVHGHWGQVIDAIAAAEGILGTTPDIVLQVGDAEPYRNDADLAGAHVPSRYRHIGEFAAIVAGDLRCPVYFIGGNHEPYPAYDACPGPFPYEWSPSTNAFYLGRYGATVLGQNLRVAWLSGTYSQNATRGDRQVSNKSLGYFLEEEVRWAARAARPLGGVDVLVTHDWPAGVATSRQGGLVGNEPTRRLLEVLRPALHICGHMHLPLEASVGPSMVHGLNAVPAALERKPGRRDGWWRLYRLNEERTVSCLATAGSG